MKYLKQLTLFIIVVLTYFLAIGCSSEDDPIQTEVTLTDIDQRMLLFMLEEEKLARDVYTILYDQWDSNQFDNIKESEQRHMNYVAKLLDDYSVTYQILEPGLFQNQDIQQLYNQLLEQGSAGEKEAFLVGATIEDLDINDLQNAINDSNNSKVMDVLEKLLCGSKNHMRAFSKGLTKYDTTYIPQYISSSEYAEILDARNAHCG